MNVSPINKSINQCSFKGLWTRYERFYSMGEFHEVQDITYCYYPFADESDDLIKKSIKEKTYIKEFEGEEKTTIKSNVRIMDRLKFTKEEFQEYKHFYGKKLTPYLEILEFELKRNFLDKYLNKGFLYKTKQLLHNIFYILPKSLRARAGV